MLIVRDAFLGVRRFGDFQKSLGIAKNILAMRLERLAAHGIIERRGSERRPVYHLTDRGRALLPATVALMQWGDQWVSGNKPPVIVTDEKGRPVAPVKLRSDGGDVSALTIRFHPGPGATARTRRFLAELSSSSDVMVAPSALPRKKTAR